MPPPLAHGPQSAGHVVQSSPLDLLQVPLPQEAGGAVVVQSAGQVALVSLAPHTPSPHLSAPGPLHTAV